MATPPPQWNPSDVLKIESILTCSGWAHSKGRKCCNRIAKENRDLATDIMEDMALLDVRSTNFKSLLKSLAKPLLCRAYHVKDPDQHSSLQRQWGKRIEAFKVTVNARRTPVAATQGSASVTVEELQGEIESLRASMAVLIQRTAGAAGVEFVPNVGVPTTHSQGTSGVHQATDLANERPRTQIEGEHLHPSPSRPISNGRTQNVATSAATSPSRHTPSEEQPPSQAPSPSPSPSPSSNASAVSPPPATHTTLNPTTITAPHSAAPSEPPILPTPGPAHPNPEEEDAAHGRKAIEGQCSICCEDMKNEDNLSWCKAQCGQNFHADCVGVWLGTLREGRRTCPYCRVDWVD